MVRPGRSLGPSGSRDGPGGGRRPCPCGHGVGGAPSQVPPSQQALGAISDPAGPRASRLPGLRRVRPRAGAEGPDAQSGLAGRPAMSWLGGDRGRAAFRPRPHRPGEVLASAPSRGNQRTWERGSGLGLRTAGRRLPAPSPVTRAPAGRVQRNTDRSSQGVKGSQLPTRQPCDVEQVTHLLWASVFLSRKWAGNTHLPSSWGTMSGGGHIAGM